MTSSINIASRSSRIAAGAALLAVAALGFAGAAQARDNISFSVGISSPGIGLGVTNAYPVYSQAYPVYSQPQPVYVQPQPVYVQPAQVYVQPRPVYIQPAPVYVQPRPVYYGAQPIYVQPQQVYRGHWRHGGYRDGRGDREDREDREEQHRGYGYQPNYAPIYYRR